MINLQINKNDIEHFKCNKNIKATFFNNSDIEIVSLKLDKDRLVGKSEPIGNYDRGILMINGYYSARLVKDAKGWIVPDLTCVEFDFSNIRFSKNDLLIKRYIGIRSKGDDSNFTFCWESNTGITKHNFSLQSGAKLGLFVFDSEKRTPPIDFMQIEIPVNDKTIIYTISGNSDDGFLVRDPHPSHGIDAGELKP